MRWPGGAPHRSLRPRRPRPPIDAPVLVIDASLDNRIASELRARGREAVALSQLGFHNLEDPPMLLAVSRRFSAVDDPFVLVTSDDAMPGDHGAELNKFDITLATVDPRVPEGYTQNSWGRDVIHRWAHAMQMQTPATWRRYSLTRHSVWTARRRPVRARATG